MSILKDLLGTILNTFQIGIGAAGSKTLRFKNASQLDIVANPTSNVTLTLPNNPGRLATHIDGYNVANAVLIEHFVGGLTDWSANQSGTSAAATVGGIADPGGHPGICSCTTGTTATGKAGVISAANAVQLAASNSSCYFRADIRVPTLSDGTNSFAIRLGLSTDNNGDSANYIFFRYTHSTNSGNWQCCTRQASGTETVVNTSTALAANTWQTLQWIYDSAAANVTFYINETLVGTITTTIPTTAGQTLQGNAYILKTVGTTARTLEIDYIYLAVNPV